MNWVDLLIAGFVLTCVFGFGAVMGAVLARKNITLITDSDLMRELGEILRERKNNNKEK
jgi:hypothetical protein